MYHDAAHDLMDYAVQNDSNILLVMRRPGHKGGNGGAMARRPRNKMEVPTSALTS
jgi:hypothetical protein